MKKRFITLILLVTLSLLMGTTAFAAAETPVECRNAEEVTSILEYMMSTGTTTFEITQDFSGPVDGSAAAWAPVVQKAWETARDTMAEFWPFFNKPAFSVKYVDGDTLKFKFALGNRFGLATEEAVAQAEQFKLETQTIIDSLYASGSLTDTMSAQEKARVIFSYVGDVLEYDLAYADNTAQEALEEGKAVCHGYTALFNRLCKLAGLEVSSRRGYTDDCKYHVWSVVKQDGIEYHVDATWGDKEGEIWFWNPF